MRKLVIILLPIILAVGAGGYYLKNSGQSSDIAEQGMDELDIAEQGMDELDIAEQGMDELDIAEQGMDELDIAEQGLDDQNNVDQGIDTGWSQYSKDSEKLIDNSGWQQLLDGYLISDTESGVNLFDYEGLLDDGRKPLDAYVGLLEQVDPDTLNRNEQKAYWINLYNSLTVQLILDNYPVVSITKLGSGFLTFGPWKEAATVISGVELSLDDIEHKIIRPLYNDYRIHFAVNCASISCPNLAADAFSGPVLDDQLDKAAGEYLNHPRGVKFVNSKLHLSTLFEWYSEDFGSNQAEVLATLGKHVNSDAQAALVQFKGKPKYAYDWGLNGYCSIDDECGG